MNEQLVKATEVTELMGHVGTQLRKGFETLRRDLELQLPDDCREAILGTFDAGVLAAIKAAAKAIEQGADGRQCGLNE